MCLVEGMLGVSATTAASVQAVAGLAISAGSLVHSISTANYQAAVARRRADIQHQNQQLQQNYENQNTVNQHIAAIRAQQAADLAGQKDALNANKAANNAYVAEQIKKKDAQTAAAFKMQDIYAKQIGAQGSVFATGATGKSIGLLAMDAERKGGFARAKELATKDSLFQQSDINMYNIETQRQSKVNIALASIPAPVQAAVLPPAVTGDYPIELKDPTLAYANL
tara:strand:- start:305 stop:979 length:675 start_codon:yes stop_codon:yes gene_type:complete